jgi:hypothetical protein
VQKFVFEIAKDKNLGIDTLVASSALRLDGSMIAKPKLTIRA